MTQRRVYVLFRNTLPAYFFIILLASHDSISPINVLPAKGAVVYLRSFSEDRKTSQTVGTNTDFGALNTVLTEEEQLVKALSSVAAVIAVGDPREELPALGATRMRFQQDEWREGVRKLLREASLVVIRPGAFSPGVKWEIQEALNHITPHIPQSACC